MAIHFGNDKIKEIYVGSDKIKEVYHGGELVWSSATTSYVILTDDTRIDFDISNTPITNFVNSTASSKDITVNSILVNTGNIKKIVLNEAYGDVQDIPANTFYYFNALQEIDLRGLGSVRYYYGGVLSYCGSLKTIYVSGTPSLWFSNVLVGLTSIELINVPSELVGTYKSASGWSTYADKISGI